MRSGKWRLNLCTFFHRLLSQFGTVRIFWCVRSRVWWHQSPGWNIHLLPKLYLLPSQNLNFQLLLKIVFSSFQMNLFTPPVYFIRWFPKSETGSRQRVFLLAIFWQRDKETKSAELERNRSTCQLLSHPKSIIQPKARAASQFLTLEKQQKILVNISNPRRDKTEIICSSNTN